MAYYSYFTDFISDQTNLMPFINLPALYEVIEEQWVGFIDILKQINDQQRIIKFTPGQWIMMEQLFIDLRTFLNSPFGKITIYANKLINKLRMEENALDVNNIWISFEPDTHVPFAVRNRLLPQNIFNWDHTYSTSKCMCKLGSLNCFHQAFEFLEKYLNTHYLDEWFYDSYFEMMQRIERNMDLKKVDLDGFSSNMLICYDTSASFLEPIMKFCNDLRHIFPSFETRELIRIHVVGHVATWALKEKSSKDPNFVTVGIYDYVFHAKKEDESDDYMRI